ncbi:MAG: mechanosensitive ion channel family protein [Promethearchaeota archaeon]
MVTLLDLIFNAIYVAIIIVLILVIYRIIMFLVRRGARKQSIPLEAINGIKIAVRLVTVILIIIALLTFIPGSVNYLISISSITGLIIGFASTQVVSQFIAGIYLLFSRPFKVNDLVKINNIDGLIQEIGLNFTTLQKFSGTIVKIPNKTILDTDVLKYTIKLTPDILKEIGSKIAPESASWDDEESSKEKKSKHSKKKSRKERLNSFKKFLMNTEIIRYTFEIAVDLDQIPEKVIKAVNEICEKHKKIYRYRPQFIITYLYWRVHIRFKVYCHNPRVIMKNHSMLIKDLMSAIYGGD